ncbi:MAG: N-acetylglucosamine-6-phosphate deacetylase, partial [Acidimicrobiales bacterium]
MTLLIAGRLASALRVVPRAWLRIEGETVAEMGIGAAPGQPDIDPGEGVIVPGFVDLHCHGGGGGSYGSADAQEAANVAAFHHAHGTTSGMASLVSDGGTALHAQVRVLADLAAAGVVAGIHLEGPYLARSRCGAHDPAALRDPDPREIERLVTAARGAMRMVTLAPERPGALAALPQLSGA